MILPKIALRNLSRQKRRSILLGGALSFGMFILVVVNGVTGGLISSVQKNFADLVAGHVFFLQVEKGPDGKLISISRNDKDLLKVVESSGLKYSAVTRRTACMGSVIFTNDSASRQITGVNWDEESNLPDSLNLMAGDAHKMKGSDGIIVSVTLAESIGLIQKKKLSYPELANLRRDVKIRLRNEGRKSNLDKEVKKETELLEKDRGKKQIDDAAKAIGETVLVKLKTIYGQENVAEFRVAAIYKTEMDYSAYVDRDALNGYIDMPKNSFNICGIMLKDYSNLERKTQVLYNKLKDKYDLVPYSKISGRSSETVLSDLDKEKFSGQKTIVTNLNNELGSIVNILTGVQAGSFVLFLIILAVIMVGLVNTFRIVVYERTKEIGTMRALGTQRKQVRNLFVIEAVFLGVAGTIPGTLLGVIALNILSLFRFDTFTELSLFLDGGHLGFTISPVLLFGSVFVVIVFTLLAALIPARKAAKMEPAQALRTQF